MQPQSLTVTVAPGSKADLEISKCSRASRVDLTNDRRGTASFCFTRYQRAESGYSFINIKYLV